MQLFAMYMFIQILTQVVTMVNYVFANVSIKSCVVILCAVKYVYVYIHIYVCAEVSSM